MDNELTVIGSELPVLQTKGTYKYLKEITGNGAYYQVAWQKLADGYVALYGTTPIQINVASPLQSAPIGFRDQNFRGLTG